MISSSTYENNLPVTLVVTSANDKLEYTELKILIFEFNFFKQELFVLLQATLTFIISMWISFRPYYLFYSLTQYCLVYTVLYQILGNPSILLTILSKEMQVFWLNRIIYSWKDIYSFLIIRISESIYRSIYLFRYLPIYEYIYMILHFVHLCVLSTTKLYISFNYVFPYTKQFQNNWYPQSYLQWLSCYNFLFDSIFTLLRAIFTIDLNFNIFFIIKYFLNYLQITYIYGGR